MGPLCRGLFASLLTAGLALSASAQDRQQDRQPDQIAPNPAAQQGTLTGKERLGPKWMDEQRLDNCKVPVDKRGTRPRSSTCPHVPVG
jgi:hypothetical protein